MNAPALVAAFCEPALLTRIEAARYLRLSARKLDQLAASRELMRVKLGASVRYDRADLDAFIAARKIT